jgi:DNA (cytosine-5)-methyltransferase 1
MKHLDLFSGIGGFSYAVDQVWDNVEHTFCEIDPYCQALLKKRFEGSVIYSNIRELFSWDIGKNVGICYSKVCEQSNNKKQIYETLLSLMRQNSKEELLLCVNIAESKCPFLLAMQEMVEESFAQMNVVTNIKEDSTEQTPGAVNGCVGREIQIGKTGKIESVEITEKSDIKKPNKDNGEEGFLPGMGIPVSPVGMTEDTTLTHITLKDGSIVPKDDLIYLMELLYAKLATKKYICNKKRKSVDLLTAGFPCQPFSQAGKRRGTKDDRWLWYDLLRIIRETKPTFLLLENVRGILTIEQGMVFEQVCLDLEGEGYEVQAFVIPAVAVNAPHRRDRVWFVANRRCERQEKQEQQATGGEQCDSDVSNTSKPRRQHGRSREQRNGTQQQQQGVFGRNTWNKNWLEVATELCGVDDGLPATLDGFELSKPRHRVERLKALGNSIVPQVAVEIMKGIRLSKEEGGV